MLDVLVSPIASLRHIKIPLYSSSVSAGFPSPAEDYIEAKLDLNELLVKRPAATFFVRVSGHAMVSSGIHSGDILIIDRSIKPANGKIVIAVMGGELIVRRLFKTKQGIYLTTENANHPAIEITNHDDTSIWGVVTSIIHVIE